MSALAPLKDKDGWHEKVRISERSKLRDLTEEQLKERFEKHSNTKLSSDVIFDIQKTNIEIKVKNEYEYPSWLSKTDRILQKIEKELGYEESKNSPQYNLMVYTFIATLLGIIITIIMGIIPFFISLNQKEYQSYQSKEHTLDTDVPGSTSLPPQP